MVTRDGEDNMTLSPDNNNNNTSNNSSNNSSRSNSITSSSLIDSDVEISDDDTSTISTSSTTTCNNHNYLKNNNNTIGYNNAFINLPLEIIENILHNVGQSSLRSSSMVSKEWNRVVNMAWHTIDLSKSRHHLTHFPNQLKHLKKSNSTRRKRDATVATIDSLVHNLISNYGFLVPGCNGTAPPIFQKNILHSKRAQETLATQLELRVEQFFVDISQRYSRVEVLDLSGCTEVKLSSISVLAQAFSSTLTKLMTRRCKSTTLTDEGFANQVIGHLPRLTTLALGEMPYVGALTLATAVRTAPSLTALGLGRCNQVDDAALAQLLPMAPRLKTIGLNNLANLNDETVRSIGVQARHLTIFSVSNVRNLSSDTLATIALCCPHLGSIDVGGCDNVDSTVLEAIAANCHELFQLNLTRCVHITNQSLDHVIQKCRLLRILFVSHTNVDDDLILNLIDSSPKLETLIAVGCSFLTQATIEGIFKLGTERLSKMTINMNGCTAIGDSLLSILQHITQQPTIIIEPTKNNSPNVSTNQNSSSKATHKY